MALINTETFIPQLLIDYVDSRRTELSLPTSTNLPFLAGVNNTLKTYPHVTFHCPEFEFRTHERLTLTIEVAYVKGLSSDETTDESSNAAKIRSALADVESWKTWLLALTTPEKTDWRITNTRVLRGGIDIDAENGRRRRFTLLEIRAMTTESTFPAA